MGAHALWELWQKFHTYLALQNVCPEGVTVYSAC